MTLPREHEIMNQINQWLAWKTTTQLEGKCYLQAQKLQGLLQLVVVLSQQEVLVVLVHVGAHAAAEEVDEIRRWWRHVRNLLRSYKNF